MPSLGPRLGLSELDLLVMVAEDPVSVEDLMVEAGVREGVDRDVVQAILRQSVEGPLRSGRIRATHWYGTAVEAVLDDGTDPDHVLPVLARAVDGILAGQPSVDFDFWFEATPAGVIEARRRLGLD